MLFRSGLPCDNSSLTVSFPVMRAADVRPLEKPEQLKRTKVPSRQRSLQASRIFESTGLRALVVITGAYISRMLVNIIPPLVPRPSPDALNSGSQEIIALAG